PPGRQFATPRRPGLTGLAFAADIGSVSTDVVKAQEALARGDREEARVFAWNALPSATLEDLVALARVAHELGDEDLLREVVQRGPEAEPGPEKPIERRRRLLRLLSLLPVLVALVLLATVALHV